MQSQRSIAAEQLIRESRDSKTAEIAVKSRRQSLADFIDAFLEKSANDWNKLSVILKKIATLIHPRNFFTPKQRDHHSFMADEKIPHQRLTRETVGTKSGNVHLAFFALASGFRGRPHHHSNVNCVSAVLEGPLTEVTYKEHETGGVTAVLVETRQRGSVSADLANSENDKFIHSMGNYNKEKIVYSVHVYGAAQTTNFNFFYPSPVTNPRFVETEAEKQIQAESKRECRIGLSRL